MEQEKLKELFNSLTLSEKIGQMTQAAPMLYHEEGEITGPVADLKILEADSYKVGTLLGGVGAAYTKKLQAQYLNHNEKKIPLIFMSDVIHGYKTIFPVPLAIGCSFDLSSAYITARVSAIEASVSGVHVTFSPMVDLVRDPRWGRVMESTGEDTYLNSLFAKAFVYGYQTGDNDLDSPFYLENFEGKEASDYKKEETLPKKGVSGTFTLASCVKHFAGYGAVEAGREYNTVDMSMLFLRQFHLPSYHAAIEAGCEMLMTAFNIIEGVPCLANSALKCILRNEWNFRGVTISDWGAVKELILHGVAEDEKEAAYRSIIGGLDIEMMTSTYYHHLEELCDKDPSILSLIDEACFRILTLKNKLGLFENPNRFADEEKEKELLLCKRHRRAAREVATKSIVLLKNNMILPLKKTQKIALLGPFAKSNDVLGPWSFLGEKKDAVTLYDGLIAAGFLVKHVQSEEEFLKDADVILLALGEASHMSGEASSLADISLSKEQVSLIKDMKKYNKPMAAVLMNGRPLILTDVLDDLDAILETWFLGIEAGNAIADVLSGDVNPSGRLTMSFPYAVGQIPVYYNHFRTGRPSEHAAKDFKYKTHYLDIPNEPLFPFGFGLSYTTFIYKDFYISSADMDKSGIKAYVTVKNTGEYTGIETVQFYLKDVTASVVRPEKQLIYYKQITLAPLSEETIEFQLKEEMLRYYNNRLELVSDNGEFILMVGSNSRDVSGISFYYRE